MEISKLITELKETKSYKNFITENPSAFFSAGFFVLDSESKNNKIQLDFFLPEKNKIAVFEYPFAPNTSGDTEQRKEPKIHEDKIEGMLPQTTEIKYDIKDVKQLAEETIKKNNSKITPTKIISILKNNQWNITCMDNCLGIVQIKIDAITGEQISFNKGSLMDIMQIKKKQVS